MKTIHLLIITISLIGSLLTVKSASAGLLNPNYVYARAGMATPSTQFVGTTREHDLTDIFNPTAPHIAVANYNELWANTGLGFTNAGGYNTWWQSAIKLQGNFEISDLVVTYNGTGTAATSVRTRFHLTHGSGLTAGAKNGNSRLDYRIYLSGQSTRGLTFEGSDINTGGIWEEFFNLNVGSYFNLRFDAQMIIANAYNAQENAYRGQGFYSAVLGGSPVFNLPDGYVVNSADGSIKNNYFVGNLDAQDIPEPSTLLLFGLCIAAIIFARSKSTAWHMC